MWTTRITKILAQGFSTHRTSSLISAGPYCSLGRFLIDCCMESLNEHIFSYLLLVQLICHTVLYASCLELHQHHHHLHHTICKENQHSVYLIISSLSLVFKYQHPLHISTSADRTMHTDADIILKSLDILIYRLFTEAGTYYIYLHSRFPLLQVHTSTCVTSI
jgi:hypothetical protein